ncbi:arabinofuranosyltransferase [Pseudonocardia nematodicida]|uniref:Galactan 5-O-arabinofuranosyltransferase n=1 Tax=Pseudonocardia nematodicida TaxID=1206997 RepID=A0ABV1K9Q8_9PSEU
MRPGPDAAGPDPLRRRRAALVDLLLGPVVAVGVAGAVLFAVDGIEFPADSNVGLALTATGGALIAILLAAAGWSSRFGAPLAWIGLAALPAWPLALFLAHTPHYLFGVSGDQQFRVEFLTRFADSARLADFAYADLPPYYPAAWFWVGGRAAALLGVEAWAFHKAFSIATIAVTAVLAYGLWTLVTTRRRALGAAVATTLAGLATLAAYTPYSWLTAALVPPLAVLGLRLVRRGPRGPWLRTALTAGLVLGCAAVTHTQILVFASFVLVVIAADGLLVRRVPPARLAVTVGVVVAVSVPIALVHWLPYLLASAGEPTYSAGQHFLAESGSRWPLPMLEPTALGALCLAGTVWIVLRSGRSEVARALAVTVACGYAWYLLSTVVLAAGTTLLAFRIEPILTAALACGAVWGAGEVLAAVRARAAARAAPGEASEPAGAASGGPAGSPADAPGVTAGTDAEWLTAPIGRVAETTARADPEERPRSHQAAEPSAPTGPAGRGERASSRRTARAVSARDRGRPAAAVLAVLAAVAVLAQVQTVPETYAWAGPAQDVLPDGRAPDGARDDAEPDARLGELRSTVDGLTGRAPRAVVLASANQKLLTYTPYFSFQVSIPQYANPLADFPARTDELRRWAAAADPRALLAALDASPYRAPSVFVFSRTEAGDLQLPTAEDRFPNPDSGAPPATFDPQLFDDPAWQRRDVGPYAVLVRADVPPVP